PGELARPGVGSKSVSSLFSRKPRPGNYHAAAADLLDRKGVADDVAPAIRHGEMGGRDAFSALAIAPRRSVLERIGISGCYGAGGGGRPNQRSPLCRELFGEQASQGNVDDVRVAQVGVAVGKGEPRRLEVAMQGLGAAQVVHVEAFQDVE